LPLTLTLSRRERGLTELPGVRYRPERLAVNMDSLQNFQVDVLLQYPRICSLYLWERAGVRG
jgi:hypothetical protein